MIQENKDFITTWIKKSLHSGHFDELSPEPDLIPNPETSYKGTASGLPKPAVESTDRANDMDTQNDNAHGSFNIDIVEDNNSIVAPMIGSAADRDGLLQDKILDKQELGTGKYPAPLMLSDHSIFQHHPAVRRQPRQQGFIEWPLYSNILPAVFSPSPTNRPTGVCFVRHARTGDYLSLKWTSGVHMLSEHVHGPTSLWQTLDIKFRNIQIARMLGCDTLLTNRFRHCAGMWGLERVGDPR